MSSMSSNNQELVEGSKAPDFHLKSDDGNAYSLSQFRGKEGSRSLFLPQRRHARLHKRGLLVQRHFSAFLETGSSNLGCEYLTISILTRNSERSMI